MLQVIKYVILVKRKTKWSGERSVRLIKLTKLQPVLWQPRLPTAIEELKQLPTERLQTHFPGNVDVETIRD